MGNRGMLAGVALHSLHHLTGVVSIAVGALAYTRERLEGPPASSPSSLRFVEVPSAESGPNGTPAIVAGSRAAHL